MDKQTEDASRFNDGEDTQGLTYFIRLANKVCNEAIQDLEEPLLFLSSIDSLFMNFIKESAGIRPATASLLLINAHASFRAALTLAFSGQLLPVYMTLRGSIESSLYAHAIAIKPELEKIWVDRAKDEESRNKCRDSFSIGKMFQYLTKGHDKVFSDNVREHYAHMIDFGAHPNMLSVFRSASLKELDDDQMQLSYAYLHGHGSFEVRQSLVAIAEVGLVVLLISLICFPDHPQVHELNIKALELQGQIQEFIEDLELNCLES